VAVVHFDHRVTKLGLHVTFFFGNVIPVDSNTVGRMDMARYLIQFDTISKRYPYRVITLSGIPCAYFVNRNDAIAYCEGR
jgi:hypothetical protein